jgi:crossover junction endodeoxyribonuclease RuvC
VVNLGQAILTTDNTIPAKIREIINLPIKYIYYKVYDFLLDLSPKYKFIVILANLIDLKDKITTQTTEKKQKCIYHDLIGIANQRQKGYITIRMKILGIDPGTAIIGWGLIETLPGSVTALKYGCIKPESKDLSERLICINENINQIIETYHPDTASVEELFFATNAKTAISVGQARGVILLSIALKHLPAYSYTPLVVKQTVCGDGHADKDQVGKMIMILLKLKNLPKPDDITDALAIALTHAYRYKMNTIIL